MCAQRGARALERGLDRRLAEARPARDVRDAVAVKYPPQEYHALTRAPPAQKGVHRRGQFGGLRAVGCRAGRAEALGELVEHGAGLPAAALLRRGLCERNRPIEHKGIESLRGVGRAIGPETRVCRGFQVEQRAHGRADRF